MISTDRETGRESITDFVQCVHCGRSWQFVAGSGRERGYCLACDGITCGPGCIAGDACVPKELMLENMEAGRPLNYRPIKASVGGVLLGT